MVERVKSKELHKIDMMKFQFFTNISHEFRTPLTVIAGYLETMLEHTDEIPPRWPRALNQMSQQAARMQLLLNDLLLLAKLEATNPPTNIQPVAIASLLQSIKSDAQALSAERNHQISLEADPTLLLKGSESELRSAFSNLVFNAVKYTPDNGEVHIRWWCNEHGAHLAVQDSGIGIESKHLPRLTERFYRVDSSRASNTGGTGLGLAIVKHIVQAHGGRVTVAVSQTDSHVDVTVTDEGPGIPAYAEDRVFDPFYSRICRCRYWLYASRTASYGSMAESFSVS